MSEIDDSPRIASTSVESDTVHRLKPNAVGLVGVLFMAVATAAPITAMVGNVPIAIGFGNGAAAPAGYLVATIVLGLFAVGYAAMSRHITATGAFYGYISHGLGRVVGLAAGFLTALAYMVFEPALVGIFAFFSRDLFASLFDVHLPWLPFAVAMIAANAVLTYFDINLAAKVLGGLLISEIVMLTLMAGSVVVRGGGPEGWSLSSLNPINGMTGLHAVIPSAGGVGTMTVVGSAGVGLFFAFWSWVGFESSAMYGEESKNPKKIIPVAIMSSVLGIGAFYVVVSWLAIVGTGPTKAIALAQDTNTAGEIFFGPVRDNLGGWAVTMFQILLTTGSFACGMAFHNCAARYIYAIGREDIIALTAKTVGRTHHIHGSPHVASFVQSGVALVIVVWFAISGRDPYSGLFGLGALVGTSAILIVQALAAFSVVSYFHVRKQHPETAHWFRTFLAPGLGGLGMVYVIYLLIENASFAAGSAAQDIIFTSIPYVVGGTALVGVIVALVLRSRFPHRYDRLGRVVLDEER